MASEDLLKKAVAAFNALSPEQQAQMLEEQRQSWVRGNIGLSRDERGMTSPVMPRPAPAATDTGLVTVGGEYLDGHTWKPMPAGVTDFALRGFKTRALVTRSQAEAIIAAKDAEIERLQKINAMIMGDDENAPRYTTKRLKQEVERVTQVMRGEASDREAHVKTLIADNAALTARVKELEADLKTYQDDTTEEVNEKIDLEFKVVDLEAKLTAAKQFIQFCADGFFVTDDELRGAARAALGRKTSC